MTEKRQRFVVEYIKDSNATQAAIRAGFSAKTAKAAGSRLLTDVDVKLAIEKMRAPIIEAAGVTLESHLNELAQLRDEARMFGQFGPAVTAAVSRGKAAGLYTERLAVTGEIEMLAFRRRSA